MKLTRSQTAGPLLPAALRLSAVAALTGALLLAAPLPAAAEDPVNLGGAYVLDRVGAVSGDEAAIQSALDSLYDRANIQLFAVFVGEFENPSSAIDWANATAVDNGLGVDDVLLAVAVDDRQYALSIDEDFQLSEAQLDRVEQAIESRLRADDWGGAVIAGAQALEAEATGVVGPNQPSQPSEPNQAGAFPWGWVLGGAAVVGGGIFIFSRIRKRNSAGQVTANPERMTQEELDRRAGSLLVQLDDSLKTSEQELGFAVAQFGEGATGDFAAVLASAKQKVAKAFELRQQLDDAFPETAEQKRAMTTQIIQLCESADQELDAQADAFDELRKLEQNAPAALAQARADAEAAKQRRASAETALTALKATYADSAVAPVADNLTQADKLFAFAEAAGAEADAAIAAGNTSDAAIAVRTVQAGVGQIGQLFDAIDDLTASLGETAAKLDAAIADTKADIAAAKALPSAGSGAALVPAIAAAEAALTEATANGGDPVAVLARVDQANTELDRVFADVRTEQDKIAKAKSQLDSTITAARSAIQSAAEYITTRRGGIGDSARTRVSEADRHLTQAISLSATDPVAALAAAQTALQLGNSALALARNDVSSFQNQVTYDSSTRSRGGDGADLGGLIGGFLGGMLGSGGGSSRGGGWSSGWPSSSSRSGSSSNRSPRSSRSGGFGGSRRSSGGGGGGRSRGGRF